MTGQTGAKRKRDHFIPRFFLRRFLLDHSKKQLDLRVIRKTGQIFNTRPENIAVSVGFYRSDTDPNNYEADERITQYEQKIIDTLSEIDGLSDGSCVNATRAAEIVTHMTIRTAHLRSAFRSAVDQMFESKIKELSSGNGLRRWLRLDEPMPSRDLRNILREEYARNDIKRHGIKYDAFERAALANLRANWDEIGSKFHQAFSFVVSEANARMTSVLHEAHIKALQKSASPFPRIRHLANMNWLKIIRGANSFVLPDCVCVVETKLGFIIPFMLADRNEIKSIIMPISHDSLLVGFDPGLGIGTLEVDAINEAFVGCAWDFVVTNIDAAHAPDAADKMRVNANRAVERLTSDISKL